MMARVSRRLEAWARGWLILAVFGLFLVFETLTLPLLQAAPGGDIEPLDSRLFYTPAEAAATLERYGDANRFWMRVYLTWDVVNPLLYGFLFALLLSWLFQRGFKPESKLRGLNLVPLGAAACDLLENLAIVALLAAQPAELPLLAWTAALATAAKSALLVFSLLLVLIGLGAAARNRFRIS